MVSYGYILTNFTFFLSFSLFILLRKHCCKSNCKSKQSVPPTDWLHFVSYIFKVYMIDVDKYAEILAF